MVRKEIVKLLSDLGVTSVKQDIFEIWNSEKAKRIRSYSKRLSKRFLCTKCEFDLFCSTNYCIAENFIKFGKFIPSGEDLNKCKI